MKSIKGSSKYEVLWTLTQKLWLCDGKTNELTNERTYERTNGWTEKPKLYTPTYLVCQQMDGQTNRFLADSYIRSTFQLGDNEI